VPAVRGSRLLLARVSKPKRDLARTRRRGDWQLSGYGLVLSHVGLGPLAGQQQRGSTAV
jgi:hypothetical protein